MKIGTVLGDVQLQQWASGFEGISCKQVRLCDQILVAADCVGVQTGDLVLLTEGDSANAYRQDLRCDALIVGKVENLK